MSALPLILSAGAGLGQAIAGALPSKAKRYNKQKIDQLLAAEQAGTLGLSDQEKEQLQRNMLDPIRQQQSQFQSQQAALQAAGGMTSGADLARLQATSARTLADAAGQAAGRIADANAQAKQQQQAELNARMAAREAGRVENINNAFGAMAGLANQAGQIEAGTPGMNPFATGKQQMVNAGVSPDDAAYLQRLPAGTLEAAVQAYQAGQPVNDPQLLAILQKYGS